MPTSRPLPVLLPERLRRVPRSFAWIDHRLRSGGFLEKLTPEEIALYLFLALAADRHGLSCWRLDRVARELPFDVAALKRARDGLVAKDLVIVAHKLARIVWRLLTDNRPFRKRQPGRTKRA